MQVINMVEASYLDAEEMKINHEWKSKVPEGEKGDCRIQKFSITPKEAKLHNVRVLIHGMSSDHFIHPGDYTRLMIDGATMMSDTQKEYMDHMELFGLCGSNVLIIGLGLGCAATVIAAKPYVKKVTIIEINQNVIDLVGPTLMQRFGDKVEIICADGFAWQAPKGVRYSAGWFDIWLDITDRNIPDMVRLRRKFARRCNWTGCWAEDECRWMDRVVKEMKAKGLIED